MLSLPTDGLSTQVPLPEGGAMATTVLQGVAMAEAAGIAVCTIGIGESGNTSPGLLCAIANRSTMSFHEQDAEDLVRGYDEIARVVACP